MFSLSLGFAAFFTYFSMYGFRKPFTATSFDSYPTLFGLDFKIALIIFQLLGYTISKFMGIRFIAQLNGVTRRHYILMLISCAHACLLLLWLLPTPINAIVMIGNGMALGLIWGLVFSYLEGRTTTESMGAFLSVSFIVASGFGRSLGSAMIALTGTSELAMPFLTGCIFVLPICLGTWLLKQAPPPAALDVEQRSARVPMDKTSRRAYFIANLPGLSCLTMAYLMFTVLRDLRDNFSSELWRELGIVDPTALFALTEIPCAIIVLGLLALLIYVKDNRKALFLNHLIIGLGSGVMLLSTLLLQQHLMGPVWWMTVFGIGIFISYIPFNCLLYDRLIAALRTPANAGFLIYLSDAAGYTGSLSIIIWKNYSIFRADWLPFFLKLSWIFGLLALAMIGISWLYFRQVRLPVATQVR